MIREHNVYDSFGRLIREVDYNASGTVIANNDAAAVDTIFGYTGRDFDSDTGLQYNRARWYDPQTGRWLSQDPIGFAAGDANLYRYVGNGSTNATDPSGLWEEPKLDTKGRYVSGGGWDFNGMTVVNGYEVRSNWPGFILSTPGIYVFWPLFGGGPRATPAPMAPTILDLEASRAVRLNYQEQLVNGHTGCSRYGQDLPENELIVIETLATASYEFQAAAAGMASGGGFSGRGPFGRNPKPMSPATPKSAPSGTFPTKPQLPSVPILAKNPLFAPISRATKPGTYVFVRDADGVIHVVPDGPGLHPTVLGSGQAASAAGEITVCSGGVISEINNISYTFQFGSDVLPGVKAALEQMGFRVAPNAIKPWTH